MITVVPQMAQGSIACCCCRIPKKTPAFVVHIRPSENFWFGLENCTGHSLFFRRKVKSAVHLFLCRPSNVGWKVLHQVTWAVKPSIMDQACLGCGYCCGILALCSCCAAYCCCPTWRKWTRGNPVLCPGSWERQTNRLRNRNTFGLFDEPWKKFASIFMDVCHRHRHLSWTVCKSTFLMSVTCYS